MMHHQRFLFFHALALLLFRGCAIHTPSRRNILDRALLTGGASLSVFLPSPPANAVQGAAEYDLEYYMRDLLGGNPKQGTKAVSSGPPAPPPRLLKGPLLELLLNDDCSPSCIPSKVLTDLVPNQARASLPEKLEIIRNAASRPFQSKAPWKEAHVTDQYYFDLTSYALWKVAGDLLPDFPTRDKFARNVGREIYSSPGLITEKAIKNDAAPLTSTISSINFILDMYKSTMYCKGYKMGDNTKPSDIIFDELDDEDLVNGASVNCLISIYEPATLGASLQITGEQSRFAPDFVGTTLAAMWESVGIKASYETYFVDPEYRPNPKDYFPNEQLLQFTLSKV